MSIRITQGLIYGNYVNQMQSSLAAYMNSAEQGSTQKKINTPSDDPAGMYTILNLRNTQTYNKRLMSNCDTAKGWLNLEDKVLATQLPTVITSIKELAEQASTGTYTAVQRREIAFQVRQQFGSVLNLANTEFNGKSLFAGHKYNELAFQEGLALSSKDESWNTQIALGNYKIEGNADTTIAFQIVSDDSGTFKDLYDAGGLKYRWTKDGGETWIENTVMESSEINEAGDTYKYYTLDCDGVSVKIPKDTPDYPESSDLNPAKLINITPVGDSEGYVDANDGTVYIRPTAYYQGDVNDELQVTYMGTGSGVSAEAFGSFSGNTLIRFDEGLSFNNTVTCHWSYSTDNGLNWIKASATPMVVSDEEKSIRLPVPDGYIDVNITRDIPINSQIMIHPEDANIEYEITKDTFITVNGVGKDIFGGYVTDFYGNSRAVFHGGMPELNAEGTGLVGENNTAFNDQENNLFEIIGDFIGALETNNQDGCQETLIKLTKAEEYILMQSTKVGGLENRVDVAYDVLTSQKTDISERLSYVEDIDLTELLVNLQRQQITYQTVLQSASKIMNLSLANYL